MSRECVVELVGNRTVPRLGEAAGQVKGIAISEIRTADKVALVGIDDAPRPGK